MQTGGEKISPLHFQRGFVQAGPCKLEANKFHHCIFREVLYKQGHANWRRTNFTTAFSERFCTSRAMQTGGEQISPLHFQRGFVQAGPCKLEANKFHHCIFREVLYKQGHANWRRTNFTTAFSERFCTSRAMQTGGEQISPLHFQRGFVQAGPCKLEANKFHHCIFREVLYKQGHANWRRTNFTTAFSERFCTSRAMQTGGEQISPLHFQRGFVQAGPCKLEANKFHHCIFREVLYKQGHANWRRTNFTINCNYVLKKYTDPPR